MQRCRARETLISLIYLLVPKLPNHKSLVSLSFPLPFLFSSFLPPPASLLLSFGCRLSSLTTIWHQFWAHKNHFWGAFCRSTPTCTAFHVISLINTQELHFRFCPIPLTRYKIWVEKVPRMMDLQRQTIIYCKYVGNSDQTGQMRSQWVEQDVSEGISLQDVSDLQTFSQHLQTFIARFSIKLTTPARGLSVNVVRGLSIVDLTACRCKHPAGSLRRDYIYQSTSLEHDYITCGVGS